jgi:catechol 2,3-dioxygenase-like lactoylglutathione lyase family enzyme
MAERPAVPRFKDIVAITLFVEDLDVSKRFYQNAFGLPVHFEDDASAVFNFQGLLVNLLKREAVRELIGPAEMDPAEAGPRFVISIAVEHIDQLCEDLGLRGVALLNGPMHRPWGPRTASFRDPDGHIWELTQRCS